MFAKLLFRKKAFLSAAIVSCTLFSILGEGHATLPDDEILKNVQTLSTSHPIRKAEHMYSNTTPMVLVRDETGEAQYVLKNRYDPLLLEREIDPEDTSFEAYIACCNIRAQEAVQNTIQAFSLTKAAGVGFSFAPTYHIQGVPFTFEGENEAVPFHGFAQPVVKLWSVANREHNTRLAAILRSINSPHGALSCLGLYDAHLTEKWVRMMPGEIPDPAKPDDYDHVYKRIVLEPQITEEEYAFSMGAISRRAIENDFLDFMLTCSGDSVYRNWMLSVNTDATLLDIYLIDFEKIFSHRLDATAPMALRTIQGFYPLSEANREKVLTWDASCLISGLPEEKAKRVGEIIAGFQTCLQEDPPLSLQNLYFRVFGKMQGNGKIGDLAHYGWTNSGGAEMLTTLVRHGVIPQDPAYVGLEPQYPLFEEIAGMFKGTSRTKFDIDKLEEALTGTNHRRY